MHDFYEILNDLNSKSRNNMNEHLSFERLDTLVLGKIQNPKDRTLFRIIYKEDFKKMYVNVFDTENKNWEIEKKKSVNEYLKIHIIQPSKNMNKIFGFVKQVFLKRNILKNRKFGEWISKNKIEYNVIFLVISNFG